MPRMGSHDFQRRQKEKQRREKTAARVEKKLARAKAARERGTEQGEGVPPELDETLVEPAEPGERGAGEEPEGTA